MAGKLATEKPAGKAPKQAVDSETPSRCESDSNGLLRKPLPARLVDVDIPPDILKFCILKQIEDAVRMTISLARNHFTIVGEPDFQVVDDPEYGENYVGIHVQAAGEPEEVFRQSDAFLDSFLASIDPEKRRYINLIYH